jgi:uncharacterized protein
MINRLVEKYLVTSIRSGFVIVLYGARRTGKTVLMNTIKASLKTTKVLHVQGEDLDTAEILSSLRLQTLKQFVSGYTHLFIDEAQEIPNIGKNLKLIVDNIPELSIFITGSSAFDLYNDTGEPLVGRSKFLKLFPFSTLEIQEDYLTFKRTLENKLVYGMYPQVVLSQTNADKKSMLVSVKSGYLLKDILKLDNQKDTFFVLDLLRLLAFQIGHDVSYSELANQLKVNVRTVQRYLKILEKNFIIFSLRGFSRNLRKEISKSPRYYFWDNGIRNVIIANFNSLKNRQDTGQLWENYCVSERMKQNHYNQITVNTYFWRTYDQQEIDLIEERDGKLFAYEFKYGNNNVKMPKAFKNAYPDAVFQIITTDNFMNFIS